MNQETPQLAARRLASKWINRGFKPQALHEYQDAQGNALYWRIRLKHINDNQKWIRPMHCNNNEFVMGEPIFTNKKPLYRLPSLLDAPDATVWVVEGEWCADKLAQLGLVSTTSGGAGSVDSTDWSSLANRTVIIWPDNDEAGFRYAEQVTAALLSINCKVQRIDVSTLNLTEKADCVDWLHIHPKATDKDIAALPTIIVNSANNNTDKNNLSTSHSSISNQYRIEDNGIFYYEDESKFWICSKLEVTALTRDDRSENWGRLLQFQDADSKLHRWAMPMQMLKGSGEELCGELLRLGLEIAPGGKNRKSLLEYITTAKTEQRACCVTRTGWYNSVFVLPEITFGITHEQVIYQAESLVKDYKQAGTLDEWRTHIAGLCVGNSRLISSVSCAFAATLLYATNAESGGLHFVGESSTGKTTALRVAASVYGAPEYVSRWRATSNGLEALAALRSDTLLVLDELAQVDPKEAGEISYLLANGMGKARAAKTGVARSRYEWRLLFLSAGEINLAQHMQAAGKKIKAGQEVRLVDIPADAGKGFGVFETLHHFQNAAALSKALLEATTHYYGVAAYEFLNQITLPQNLAALPILIKTLRDQFIQDSLPENAGGQVHRVCERFALISAAGEIASYYGITGWPEGEAQQAVKQCFNAWLEQRGSADNQERTFILSQVRHFFEAHGESRFTEWFDINPRTINRAGFKKVDQGDAYFYVLTGVFRNEICAGTDYRIAAKILMQENWIKPGDDGKPYRRESLPNMRARCYVFTHKMWEAEY